MTKIMNVSEEQEVFMSNDLIKSKSNLSLNEIKILRMAIAQIFKSDTDFITYTVNITELAKALNISRSNIYTEIDKITDNLLREIVYIGDSGNPKKSWEKFQWCSKCKYDKGMLTIKLHDDLKPYLLELKKHFNHYMIADIITLKSVYSIRLYELMKEAMMCKEPYADKEVDIYISIDTIRKATGTEDKYSQMINFKEKVIDKAVNEINEKLNYYITYEPVKESRKFIGFNFNIKSRNTAELEMLRDFY